MNTVKHLNKLLIAAAASSLLLACSSAPKRPPGADAARAKLTQLQSDPQLATRAPVAIKDADVAVTAAEAPQRDAETSRHLVFIADHKVDLAVAQAQARLAEDQRKGLSEEREAARLDARTREADRAHSDAKSARSDADLARSQADAARMDTHSAQMQADAANQQAAMANQQAANANEQADAATRQAAALQQQIDQLNAKATDRGLVVTLGDLLFATGRSDLKGSAADHLGKLAAFLAQYPDRTVIIEGHTDDVGSAQTNLDLSQRRADSVKTYLVGQGIAGGRIAADGKGEEQPVAGNDSVTGRQQNRRVEVIIANTVTSAR
jgi:outer membrane protein OmpA-like peptidoglycan-associated protein